MMKNEIYTAIKKMQEKKHKLFALLIDPDKHTPESLFVVAHRANQTAVDLIFVGGSLLLSSLSNCIQTLKSNTKIPIVLFPGNYLQIDANADAILLLSLISGRNPEFLIGQHVISAANLKKSELEIISTAYMLIDGGRTTSVQYISNTLPIPANKPDIAVATALAGEMLGLSMVYLEAGSGAVAHVPLEMIAQVRQQIELPIIVGGGIRKPEQVSEICSSGADIIVVGTAIEQDLETLDLLVKACHALNTKEV